MGFNKSKNIIKCATAQSSELKIAPLCGQRWIRTTEGESQQIYSLPHLSTLVFALISYLQCKDRNYFCNFQA